MRTEICRFIIMCLSIFLWISCGYIANRKDYCRAELFATFLMAFMFDFWATFA